MKYIAKPGTWFDVGTEAILIDDYRPEGKLLNDSGLFCGLRNGKEDEEICPFSEFEEHE